MLLIDGWLDKLIIAQVLEGEGMVMPTTWDRRVIYLINQCCQYDPKERPSAEGNLQSDCEFHLFLKFLFLPFVEVVNQLEKILRSNCYSYFRVPDNTVRLMNSCALFEVI